MAQDSDRMDLRRGLRELSARLDEVNRLINSLLNLGRQGTVSRGSKVSVAAARLSPVHKGIVLALLAAPDFLVSTGVMALFHNDLHPLNTPRPRFLALQNTGNRCASCHARETPTVVED